MAARLYLDSAIRSARRAREDGPDGAAAADRALSHADSVLAHRHGRAYIEQASLIKARILLERRYDPEGAIDALGRARWLSPRTAAEAERIRMEALLAARRWDEAQSRFSRLAASPDSALAAMGRYGAGMALFYRGEFAAARDTLAALAERSPGSEWANDALETAVLVQQAERDGDGPLALLGAGLAAARVGRLGEAADSLDAIAARYPGSVLAPRGLYEAALLLERDGREAGARERLGELSQEIRADGGVDWSRRSEAEDLARRQEDLRERISEAAERLDETLESLEENRATSMEIGRKMEEVRDLLERVENEQVREAIERLQSMLRDLHRRRQ